MRFRTLFVVAGMLAVVVQIPVVHAADDTAGLPCTWSIDPSRSEGRFTVTKLGYEDVTGVFREVDGEIQYDPDRPGTPGDPPRFETDFTVDRTGLYAERRKGPHVWPAVRLGRNGFGGSTGFGGLCNFCAPR